MPEHTVLYDCCDLMKYEYFAELLLRYTAVNPIIGVSEI